MRTYHEVADPSAESVVEQVDEQERRLRARLRGIGRTVAVASGKGGVGKSAVGANLAAALAAAGRAVGALDADLDGPSLARMLGARGHLARGGSGIDPARGVAGIAVVSTDLLLPEDAPVRWSGPAGQRSLWQSLLETGALRELVADVAWGALDVLLLDLPPGTEKIARAIDLLGPPDVVLLVTTPSEAARGVVARSAQLLGGAAVPRVGLVANMVSWTCPHCGIREPLFAADGVVRLAAQTGLEIWGEIPFDPRLASDTDAGLPIVLPAELVSAAKAWEAWWAKQAG